MINIKENILNWDKKVIYAPNGFGKTRSSNILKNSYLEKGEKVEIFSRKSIESLVLKFDNNDFYIGQDAIYEYEKAKLESIINSNKVIEATMKFTKEKSATKLKDKSFYCAYNSISNTSSIPKVSSKIRNKQKLILNRRKEEIELLDLELNPNLYSKINDLLMTIDNDDLKNKKRKNNSNYEVGESIYQNLQELYIYCQSNNVTQCYLCGKKYKSNQRLLKHIEKRMRELYVPKDKISKLYELSVKVKELVYNSKSQIIKDVLGNCENVTIRKQLTTIKLYKELCECDVSYWHDKIVNTDVKVNKNDVEQNYSILELVNKIEKLNNKLGSSDKNKIERKLKLVDAVIKKIKKYINFDKDVSIEPLKNKCGLIFKINGKKIDPTKYLSESEIKRIALIVLEQEIRFQHIKTIILDDPIDSYDDYNKRIACQYIAEILSKKSLSHWYIFTNDFECVYYLSNTIKNNTIFCLEDINKVYRDAQANYEIECTPNQVSIISKNDLYYLDQFVNRKYNTFPYDRDILFCALTLTLRNVKTDFLNKYSNLEFDNKPITRKKIWSDKISDEIEKCTEHYDDANSSTIMIKDIAESYYALNSNTKKSTPAVLMNNTSLFEIYRETVSKKEFVLNNNYTDVVNYLFKKVLLINFIKYELEKKLMLKIKNNYITSNFNEVDLIRTGLSARINKAIKLDSANGNLLSDYLKKVKKIHEDYSSLYNSVDHGTILMISPYLSISIRDILNFKNEVDALK